MNKIEIDDGGGGEGNGATLPLAMRDRTKDFEDDHHQPLKKARTSDSDDEGDNNDDNDDDNDLSVTEHGTKPNSSCYVNLDATKQALVDIATRLTEHFLTTENRNEYTTYLFKDVIINNEEEEMYEGCVRDWNFVYQTLITHNNILKGLKNRVAEDIQALLLLACYYCHSPPGESIFNIILDEYPESFHMELGYDWHWGPAKMWILNDLPTNEMSVEFSTRNCQMIEKLIRRFPETLEEKKLDDVYGFPDPFEDPVMDFYRFRSESERPRVFNEGGKICYHIFTNYITRKHLMGTIQEVYGSQKIQKWLRHVTFESIDDLLECPGGGNDDNFLSSIALLCLLGMFQPTKMKLVLDFSFFDPPDFGANERCVDVDYFLDDGVSQVSFTGNNNLQDNYHLNSVLSAINRLPSSCIPPIEICHAGEEDAVGEAPFSDNQVRQDIGYDLDEVGYYVVEPNVAKGCRTVTGFKRPYVNIFDAKDLLDFSVGLASFPNLDIRGTMLTITLFQDANHDGSCNNSIDLWKEAFRILGSMKALKVMDMYFKSDPESYVPVEGIQLFLETTESLQSLGLFWGNEARMMESILFGLKENASIEELYISKHFGQKNADDTKDDDQTRKRIEMDYSHFLDCLQHHNFTLTDFHHTSSSLKALAHHYCDMNKAGRGHLMKSNASKRDAVMAFGKATHSTDVLYVLLRIRPDLWSS